MENYLVKLSEYEKEKKFRLYKITFGFDSYKLKLGKRFARIEQTHFNQKHSNALCFIEILSGDIYQTLTWFKPNLKNRLGNINDEIVPLDEFCFI